MSTQPDYDDRTGTEQPQLDYHAIAARLGCDAESLRLFVREHPNPTPAVVLGFAEADPEHRDAVERWLNSHAERRDRAANELGDEINDDASTAYRRLKGGEP